MGFPKHNATSVRKLKEQQNADLRYVETLWPEMTKKCM